MNSQSEGSDAILGLVDLDRYPITGLDSGRGAEFLAECQAHMEEHGWCNLEGFIRPDALAALMAETDELLPDAEILRIRRTIYQGAADADAPSDDPRQRTYEHVARQLADDQIPAHTMLQTLYRSDALTEFVRRVQKKNELHLCADEFQALNVVALEPGCWHGWHYDTTECTVTLLLQAPEKGGEFTFIPNSRTETSENRDAVNALLAGDHSHAKTFSRAAGTFTLFRGGYSLHGVTKVEGTLPRVTAIMTYSEEPGAVISDEINIRIYGERVAKILAARRHPQDQAAH